MSFVVEVVIILRGVGTKTPKPETKDIEGWPKGNPDALCQLASLRERLQLR